MPSFHQRRRTIEIFHRRHENSDAHIPNHLLPYRHRKLLPKHRKSKEIYIAVIITTSAVPDAFVIDTSEIHRHQRRVVEHPNLRCYRDYTFVSNDL